MKIAVMQPYLLPYIGYFQLLGAVDTFVLFDDVNYIKRGWINRNRILADGADLKFTVPVAKASQNSKINQLRLVDAAEWRGKLFKTIEHCYRRAPHYEERLPLLQNIFSYENNLLSDFLRNSIILVAGELQIETRLLSAAGRYGNDELKGSARILDICRQEGADTYINPPGGKELYDAGTFTQAGTRLYFLEPDIAEYLQFGKPFVPGLSILDVLMFNSNPQVIEMLGACRLVSHD